jgi:hypothetical protein
MSPKPSVTPDEPAPAGRPSRGWLLLAATAAAAWFAFLVALAVLTANPVTVDREQLLDSDAVVAATPTASAARSVTLRVEKTLAGLNVPDTLRAETDEPQRLTAGRRYIVPLRRTADGYAVTPAPRSLKYAPLVYPATDDALRAAEKILATAAPDPYD